MTSAPPTRTYASSASPVKGRVCFDVWTVAGAGAAVLVFGVVVVLPAVFAPETVAFEAAGLDVAGLSYWVEFGADERDGTHQTHHELSPHLRPNLVLVAPEQPLPPPPNPDQV